MIEMKRILCPVDFSDASRHALDHAAAFARWYGATLSVLHVVEPIAAAVPGTLVGPYPFRAAPDLMDLERTRAELRDFLRTAGLSDGVEACVQRGRIADVIAERVRVLPADLLALGTHGLGGFDRLVLGSTTEKLLRKAPCPVLTVPPRARVTSKLPLRRLLCPIDFSECSLAALQMAFSIAQESDAQLTILHVIEAWPSADDLASDTVLAAYYRDRERGLATTLERAIPDTVRDWCEPRTRLARGKSYQAILGIAIEESTDLIVMGVHGRNLVDLTVFGSVTNQIVRGATCPVLTVRA